jgi:hypothetical protein
MHFIRHSIGLSRPNGLATQPLRCITRHTPMKTPGLLLICSPSIAAFAQTHSFNGECDLLLWVLKTDRTADLVLFAIP